MEREPKQNNGINQEKKNGIMWDIYGTPTKAPALAAVDGMSQRDKDNIKAIKKRALELIAEDEDSQELEELLEQIQTAKATKKDVEQFNEKNKILADTFKQVTPFEFYRDIFPAGTFERKGEYNDQKANAICKVLERGGRKYSVILTDELSELDKLLKNDCVICAPVSYYGKHRTADNASQLFGICIDLDGVEVKELKNYLFQVQNKMQPTPTYIINSGHGLHLYFIFEYPVILPAVKTKYLESFQALKKALTDLSWNRHTSAIENKQFQGIWQGFRMVGSNSKMGEGCKVTAFKSGGKISIEYLNEYVPIDCQVKSYTDTMQERLTLEKAAELYPTWYEKRIIKKEPVKMWTANRALFEWWYNEIKNNATFGHRYFCIMTLAIYARKCNVSFEELESAAYSLQEKFNSLSVSDPFTNEDINAALQAYFIPQYARFKKDTISKLTSINIKTNKRNGRTQDEHLKRARAVQAVDYPNNSWRNTEGRPAKQDIVLAWQAANPGGTKAQCKRDTQLSHTTINKWWSGSK